MVVRHTVRHWQATRIEDSGFSAHYAQEAFGFLNEQAAVGPLPQ